MLFIETTGYNYSKKRCESIVKWFISKYLPRHKLDISINHRGLYREGVHGWVWVTDCDYRPREFAIEMHNFLTVEDYTRVLLHELWHVYQHVMGALRDSRGKRLWRGIDHTETDYSDQPWEQQAQEMEEVLYDEYYEYLTTL